MIWVAIVIWAFTGAGSASFLSIYIYCRGDNSGKTMAGGSGEGAELGRKKRLGMMMNLEWV